MIYIAIIVVGIFVIGGIIAVCSLFINPKDED